MSKILALSGGSVKGAFQAGVIRALFERGYEPDMIYGISAGSLNSAYLVNQLGRQKLNGEPLNFRQAGQDLWDFWETRITHPECLSKPLSLWELGWTALTKNFRGLVSTKPLRDLVEGVLDLRNLQASPVELRIGAVNIIDGGIHYVDPSYDHFYDYLLASSAVPILMPVVQINQEKRRSFLDGGLRDVAPLQKAIKDGGKHIVCISCHTQTIEGGIFETGDLLALVDRVMDIAVNEILNADLKEALLVQNQRSDLSINSIRPIQPISIDIRNFNKMDIRRMLEIGYAMGKAEEYF
ncbi:patatin-like phospholipase family protein [Aquirufa aurantiipilula]|uniref:Patatin-like phospholipase family protein n=1 Tax=Aquirufa aurantiipilula TaxID=2696561 RepID=A0ABT6BHK7_9BACT|nr:patatin-like phospholipase family protein [Aquirufa aurantiipilula]MBZ1326475.1 patatin [Aquirufa aurantiipilula]MDF5689369.1 patatin-like phospholipase family protein [Aquirufa aurantiipilula]